MLRIVVATAALLLGLTATSQARSHRVEAIDSTFCGDRYCPQGSIHYPVHRDRDWYYIKDPAPPKCSHHGCAEARLRHHREHRHQDETRTAIRTADIETRILEHPAGCPRTAFCGFGVAMKVYGRPVRDLWLAANWRRFPHADPAHGMVAVREHHVFYIEAVLSNGNVLAYDPNSGRHQTRLHVRSLAGYSVRNPNVDVANL